MSEKVISRFAFKIFVPFTLNVRHRLTRATVKNIDYKPLEKPLTLVFLPGFISCVVVRHDATWSWKLRDKDMRSRNACRSVGFVFIIFNSHSFAALLSIIFQILERLCWSWRFQFARLTSFSDIHSVPSSHRVLSLTYNLSLLLSWVRRLA